MIAERVRTAFRSKNKVDVRPESDQVISKREMEQPLPTTLDLETDPDNPAVTEKTTLPITTQSILSYRRPTKIKQRDNIQIQKGRQAASQRDYVAAIAIFDEVSPVTCDSLYYRGCARLELGGQIQIYNAIEDFSQALELLPASHNPNIYYKRAFACQLIGRYAEAIIGYSMFIQYSSSDEQHVGYLNRGLVYGEIKEYSKALEDIDRANTTCQHASKYYVYCLARAQATAGHNNEAKAKFHELANMCHDEYHTSEGSFHTHFYHGIALYELNNYSNALEQFKKAFNCSADEQEKADTKFYLGLTYYALNDIKSAKEEFEHVLMRYDQNHTRALFRLGLIESQNNDLQSDALHYLSKAHELTPHKSDILYERGELHYKMGQLDACVHDKRLALQLEHTDIDPSAVKHYYEFLIQRLLSRIKQPAASDDIYLMLALLNEKVHLLSQNASRSSIFDKDYRKMISMYEQEIEKNEEGLYSPIYFALLCNLHKHHKHAGAAMIALDQLHYHLDTKPKLQKYWNQMLNQVREMAKKKRSASQSENLENILEMVNSHISQTNNNQQNSTMLISFLVDRVAELEKIEKIRNQVKIDQEYFKKDENVNRSVFYHKMRVSLSHKFTSMAVISGDDDNEPIVKHDRTGTKTMIAQGVCLLGDALGASVPIGGEVISHVSSFIGSQLEKHEYNKFQNSMALITDVGTIEELTNLARQVARKLADCYKDQLLCLNRRPDEVSQVCLSCCPCFQRTNKDDSLKGKRPVEVLQPAEQIAQFGVAFAVQAIIDGKLEKFKFSDDTKCEDLSKAITELICCAKPNIQAKVLRRLNVDKNAILPHTPLQNSKEGETLSKWYLHDFYQKPGIYIQNGEEIIKQKPLSWMDPDLYGYRLGTLEEHKSLDELDKKHIENKSKICCC